MVWPSICLVTSQSMSISSTRASPFFMRVMMSYSQGAPSLQCHFSQFTIQRLQAGAFSLQDHQADPLASQQPGKGGWLSLHGVLSFERHCHVRLDG